MEEIVIDKKIKTIMNVQQICVEYILLFMHVQNKMAEGVFFSPEVVYPAPLFTCYILME